MDGLPIASWPKVPPLEPILGTAPENPFPPNPLDVSYYHLKIRRAFHPWELRLRPRLWLRQFVPRYHSGRNTVSGKWSRFVSLGDN